MRVPLLLKLPLYQSFRWFGWPRLNPISLTISLTNHCNHRCQTCDVYDNLQDDFNVDEWEKVFRSIGKGIYYLTVSGGEPFLRPQIVDVCRLAKKYLDPKVLLIPTNGLLHERIPDAVREILEIYEDRQVIINLSLDGTGAQHDRIRGKPGAFEQALKTYRQLKSIEAPHLVRGIHTVVSRFNVDDFERIHGELAELEPDSLICEVAENRVELGTINYDISPGAERYEKAVDVMINRIEQRRTKGMARVLAAFRKVYYRNAVRILRERQQVPPCQAGFMVAHVSPAGETWACCVEARSFGNLRENGYDFRKVWFESQRKEEIRGRIRRGECACPLANAGYVNILFHPPSLLKVARNVLG